MKMIRKILWLCLLVLLCAPAYADNLGSAIGGQSAPQSGLAGGLCYTAPIALTNGQQASLAIDCVTHALVTEAFGTTGARVISSGSTDTAATSDNVILWNSPSFLPKTESLPNCTVATSGLRLTVTDEIGGATPSSGASVYPITINPFGANTINGVASYVLNFNQQSVTMVCDGVSNWVIQ